MRQSNVILIWYVCKEQKETHLEFEYTPEAEEDFEIVRREREEVSALCNMLAIQPNRLVLAFRVLEDLSPTRSAPLVLHQLLSSMTDAGDAMQCDANVVSKSEYAAVPGPSPKAIQEIASRIGQSVLSGSAVTASAGSPFGSIGYVVAHAIDRWRTSHADRG